MEVYPWAYIYKEKEIVLFWVSTPDKDYFLRSNDGNLLSSESMQEVQEEIKAHNYKIHWDEIAKIDFDKFWTSINNLRENRSSSTKTCKVLLDGWNFIDDIAKTFQLSYEIKVLRSKNLNMIYQKIFTGNNLPSVTPDGSIYHPLWTKKEIFIIKKTFRKIRQKYLSNGYLK